MIFGLDIALARATLVIVAVAVHDEPATCRKMTELTSRTVQRSRKRRARRPSPAAQHLILCAYRPRSTLSLVVVGDADARVDAAVVDERKQALRGRGGAEEARGRRR